MKVYIACRAPGTKRAMLLTSKGELTAKRVHAALFEQSDALSLIQDAATDPQNAGWFFQMREARP